MQVNLFSPEALNLFQTALEDHTRELLLGTSTQEVLIDRLRSRIAQIVDCEVGEVSVRAGHRFGDVSIQFPASIAVNTRWTEA